MVEGGSEKYRRIFSKKLFLYLSCNQIWLNPRVDHLHFGYNTKLPKTTLLLTLVLGT
jgi:hypothetical protein